MSNWANRTKTELQQVPEQTLIPVGGSLEPIETYYAYTEGKTPNSKRKVLAEGQQIQGVYEGSFVQKSTNPKYPDKTQYKFRTNAGLVAIPECTALNKLISKVADGATVLLTYKGRAIPGDTKAPHRFAMAASKLK